MDRDNTPFLCIYSQLQKLCHRKMKKAKSQIGINSAYKPFLCSFFFPDEIAFSSILTNELKRFAAGFAKKNLS